MNRPAGDARSSFVVNCKWIPAPMFFFAIYGPSLDVSGDAAFYSVVFDSIKGCILVECNLADFDKACSRSGP